MQVHDPPSALVGRQPQLGHLLAEAAAVRAGTAHTTLVVGDAGIGKTRLITEYLARTPLARTVVGGCLEHGERAHHHPDEQVGGAQPHRCRRQGPGTGPALRDTEATARRAY